MSADASKRAADAAERQAAAAEAAVPPPPPPVDWKVVRRSEATFLLRNVGSEPALDVEVDAVDGRLFPVEPGALAVPELPPNQAIGFWIFTADELPDIYEIKVRWRGSGDWTTLPLP